MAFSQALFISVYYVIGVTSSASPPLPFAAYAEADSIDSLFTSIIPYFSTFVAAEKIQTKLPTIYSNELYGTNVIISSVPPAQSNVSVFDRDLHLHELLQPLKFNVYHFTPHKSLVHIQASLVEEIKLKLEHLVREKLVRINRDTFVFTSKRQILEVLEQERHFQEIPFKLLVFRQSRSYKVVNYCQDGGMTKSKIVISAKPCNNLVQGRHILISGLQSATYRAPASPTEKPKGSYYTILKEASKRLNFTFSTVFTKASGAKINGTWTGAIGDLLYRRVDIVLTLALADSRNAAVDYSCLLHWMRKVFYVRVYMGRQGAESFVKPFSPFLWGSTLSTVVAFAVVLCIFSKIQGEGISTAQAIDTVVRGILEESGMPLCYCRANRIKFIIVLWLIFNLIILTAYRSKLFYFLTFTDPQPVPNTFHQLAFASDYKIYYRSYGGAAEAAFARSQHPMHKALAKPQRFKFVAKTPECLQHVLMEERSRAGCIEYDIVADFVIATNFTVASGKTGGSVFKRSVDDDGKYVVVWGFRKRSGLPDVFNPLISTMLQAGLPDHWFHADVAKQQRLGIRYLREQAKAAYRDILFEIQDEMTSGIRPLPLRAVKVPVLFVLVGLSLSNAVWAWEVFMSRRRDQSKQAGR